MRRDTLEKLMAARREGRTLVRAVNLASGEEKLLDPAVDSSPLGRAAKRAAREDASRRVAIDDSDWFLTPYHVPWEIVIVGAVHIAQALALLAVPAGYRVRVIDPRALTRLVSLEVPERRPHGLYSFEQLLVATDVRHCVVESSAVEVREVFDVRGASDEQPLARVLRMNLLQYGLA